MSSLTKQNPIPKVMALVLVSICAAWLMTRSDTSTLAKLDSMSPADYIQHQRDIHLHSLFHHFILLLMMGGFYIGVIEFISFVIGLVIPKKPDAYNRSPLALAVPLSRFTL